MWDDEKEHLRTMSHLVAKNRVRPTALLPFWNIAGYALGLFLFFQMMSFIIMLINKLKNFFLELGIMMPHQKYNKFHKKDSLLLSMISVNQITNFSNFEEKIND